MLVVKPFEPGDFERWLPLWRGYQTFYEASLPEETTRVAWSRMLDPAEPMFGALAWEGDEAVGMVHWILHRSNWTVGDYCYLQDLFVAEPVRGMGAGRKLIEYVYADATRRGCSRVYWLTHETNHQGQQLYDRIAMKSGFIQYKKTLP
ncbi:MAG: GNAT family N-acetyltransferase [Bryobacteraceae bacterium]